MKDANVEGRVARGVKFLDAQLPGWYRKVSLVELQMNLTCQCVLGQIFGHYADGLETLDISNNRAIEMGFDSNINARDVMGRWDPEPQGAEFNILTSVWRRVIAERQKKEIK